MKKATGIILCAVIIIASVVSLMSCGAKSDADKIIGKWAAKVDMTELMKEEFKSLEEQGIKMNENDIKDLSVIMVLEFNKDGTYTYSLDEASFDEFFAKFKTTMKSVFETSLKSAAEAAGFSLEDYLSLLGMSLDDLVESSFSDEMKAEMKKEASGENNKGKYKVDNGKLFTVKEDEEFKDDEYTKYEFVNDKQLKFTDVADADSDESAIFAKKMLPLTFDKK